MTHQPVSKLPSLYLISGPAAAGQPMVFGSEPGEDDYSPLWREITVKWKAGVTPVLLKQDDQINALQGKGELTETPTSIVLNCPIVKVTTATTVPTATTVSQPAIYGYYDGHVDTMLSTDVSSKTQAASSHINYSAALAAEPAGNNPAIYMVSGPAAPNQPVVFGSEPGEDDYSPLWQEDHREVEGRSEAGLAHARRSDQHAGREGRAHRDAHVGGPQLPDRQSERIAATRKPDRPDRSGSVRHDPAHVGSGDAVAPVLLGHVQRLVGSLEHRAVTEAGVGFEVGNAHADRDDARGSVAGVGDGERLNGLSKAFRGVDGFGEGLVGEEDHELLAAIAIGSVFGAEVGGEHGRDLL